MPEVGANNNHMTNAQMALNASTEADEDSAPVYAAQAVAHAGLAQAYEARTASLQRYYDSLFHGDGAKHHEQQHAAAVLALIRHRLGLDTN